MVIIIPHISLSLSKQLVYFWYLIDVKFRGLARSGQSSVKAHRVSYETSETYSNKLQALMDSIMKIQLA